jgi:NTP pyrophosphatase (non-canonical NTP hydrolase)
MKLENYQAWTNETAIYPGVNEGNAAALSYVGLGLGEFGEVQGKIKKILRDSNGVITPEVREAILDETGDGLWYLARLLEELGSDFEDLADRNHRKLTDRSDRGVLQGSGDYR